MPPRPTLVLVHGASGNAHTWRPQLSAWSSWAEAVAVDLPGRGTASGPPLDTVEALADWLATIIGERGWDRPILVGHSLGGGVALQTALDHPARVGGLVMVSSAARLRVHPAILEAVANSSPDSPYRLDAAFGAGTPPEIIHAYANAASTTPPGTALADWRACDAFDVRTRLGEVRCPTLVVYGSADPLTRPKYQVQLADALPRAQRVELEGVGHMLPWEAPGALVDAVRAWREAR